MLQAAGQYRETKASMYRASENAAAEPEYIPWTGSKMNLLRFSCFILSACWFYVRQITAFCSLCKNCGLKSSFIFNFLQFLVYFSATEHDPLDFWGCCWNRTDLPFFFHLTAFVQHQVELAAFAQSSRASTRSYCARCTHTLTLSCATPSVSSWWHCWISTLAVMWPSWAPCSSTGLRESIRNATTAWRWSTASPAPSCWHHSVSAGVNCDTESKKWNKIQINV